MCRPTRLQLRGRLIRLGEMSEDHSSRLFSIAGGSTYTRKRTQHGKPQAWSGWNDRINRTPAGRGRRALWGGGEVRSTAEAGCSAEGRDLSSRQTRDVAKDMEIGKPINSTHDVQKLPMASHAKDGVRSGVREPDGNLHVRFDERGVETELRLSH